MKLITIVVDSQNEQYRIALLSPDGTVQSDGSREGSELRRAAGSGTEQAR